MNPDGKCLDITVGIVCYNLHTELESLIKSCVSKVGHKVTCAIFNHSPGLNDRQRAVWEVCERAGNGEIIGNDGKPVQCVVFDYHQNRGLVVGWNEAMMVAYCAPPIHAKGGSWHVHPSDFDGMFGCTNDEFKELSDDTNRVCILANDDIEFDAAPTPTGPDEFVNDWDAELRLPWNEDDGKSDVDRIAEQAAANRQFYGWTVLAYNAHYAGGKPWTGLGWSLIALNPIMLRTAGLGDENIVPVYFEDCDWGWRADKFGSLNELKQTRAVHWGSLHWKVDAAACFQNTSPQSPARKALIAYYRKKWGGLPGDPNLYPTPFNDPSIGLFIGPEEKGEPYGPLYDRDDIERVVLL